ncbi:MULTISPECIES: helix-turn-helix domain-containing protein [Serratia]|uniref:helix-turn-helix domain-containing protein n=1 Tax=Serratia TaxID=613 RepID=UPI00069D8109|nr:helix-turn-helix domain-containing protein [Serratia sp. 506_PEND]
MNSKANEFAFPDGGKESFKDRLQQLIGSRSVRAAAKDWNLPTSTINNYLHKGTEPALKVVLAVAEAEGVSLEWLATGLNKDENNSNKVQHNHEGQNSTLHHPDSDYQWFKVIWDSLEQHERHRLSRLLGRKGADVLTLLLEEHALDILKLSGDVREAALLLEKLPESELREILRKYRGVTNDQSVSVEQKQAV